MAADEIALTHSASQLHARWPESSDLSRLTVNELGQLFEFHGAVADLAVADMNVPCAKPAVSSILEEHSELAWAGQNRVAEEAAARRPADEDEARVRKKIAVRGSPDSDPTDDLILELAAVLPVTAGWPFPRSKGGWRPESSFVSRSGIILATAIGNVLLSI